MIDLPMKFTLSVSRWNLCSERMIKSTKFMPKDEKIRYRCDVRSNFRAKSIWKKTLLSFKFYENYLNAS